MTADTPGMPKLHLVPILSFADACEFVRVHHRHHQPPVGGKYWVGVATDDKVLHGVAIVGRPVARHFGDGQTLEVTRVAVDTEPVSRNACSLLYAACWRGVQAWGFTRLITYTEARESGASLRGAGYRVIAVRRPNPGWDRPSRPRTPNGTENVQRTLWEAA